MSGSNKRIPLRVSYAVPDSYSEPSSEMLSTCTQYPNLNSRNYLEMKTQNSKEEMYPYFEHLEVNKAGQPMVVCSNFHGREWGSSCWLYTSFSDFGNRSKALFKHKAAETISSAKFLPDNFMLLGLSNGVVELWETNNNLSETDKYALFPMKSNAHHESIVTAIEPFKKDEKKIITTSYDGKIIVWKLDVNVGEIYYENVYRKAHYGIINAVSSSPDCGNSFVTCSSDKSSLLWDVRDPKPASSVYENHKVTFTSAQWCLSNHVYIGDDNGAIYCIDLRKRNTFVCEFQAFHQSIHKLKQFGNKLCATANTSSFKIFDINDSGAMFNVFYQNDDDKSTDYIRDVYMTESEDDCRIYSVGWSSHFKEHKCK